MANTSIPQAVTLRSSASYIDTRLPSLANYQSNATDLEYDMNSIRSALQNFLNRDGTSFPGGAWYGDLVAPTVFNTDAGATNAVRGVNTLGDDLWGLQRKRILKRTWMVGSDVTIAAGGNLWVVLPTGKLPSVLIGAVGTPNTTIGTVVADTSGGFNAASLNEVAVANNALEPKNLVFLVDQATGEQVVGVTSGDLIWGLMQSEFSVDGTTITDTTPNRVQISFVRHNVANDNLVAADVNDLNGITFDYGYVLRDAFEDCPEESWLGDSFSDSGVGSTTRQVAYDNQGTGLVTTLSSSTLDVGSTFTWKIGDALDATLLSFVEGSAGDTTQMNIGAEVDTYTNSALDVDFAQGIQVDNAGGTNTINLGVTAANQIDFTLNGTVTAASGQTVTVTANAAAATLSTTGASGTVALTSVADVDIDADTAVTINTANAADASAHDFTVVTGNSTGGNAAGSAISMTAGNGFGTGTGGAVGVTAGTGNGNGVGGGITFTSGTGDGTGKAGNIEVAAGIAGAGGAGGDITVSASSAGLTSVAGGGFVTLSAKHGGGAGGDGGAVTLFGGNGTFVGGNSEGGGINALAGSGKGTGNGGLLQFTAGTSGVGGNGGNAHMTAGAGLVASGADAGLVRLTGGAGDGAGVGGAVILDGGAPGVSGPGANVAFNASASGATSVQPGGDILGDAGDGGGAGGAGGLVRFTAGNGTFAGTAGGVVSLIGGIGNTSGAGGAASVAGGVGGAAGPGGLAAFAGGAGGAAGDGGAVAIDGGAVANGTAGSVTIRGGIATLGAPGDMTIESGSSGDGNSGILTLRVPDATAAGTTADNINILGGAGVTTGSGSTIFVTAGIGGVGTGDAGDITVTGGAAGNNAASAGGAVTLSTGANAAVGGGTAGIFTIKTANNTSNDAGAINITTGGAFTTGDGGALTLQTGQGTATGAGGFIDLIAGGGAGTAGGITLTPGLGLLGTETIYLQTPAGGALVTENNPIVNIRNQGTGTGAGEDVQFHTGVTDPTAITWGSINADVGSLFFRDTAGVDGGELWLKDADAAAGWIRMATTADIAAADTLSEVVTNQAGDAFLSGAFTTLWGIADGQGVHFTDDGGTVLLGINSAADSVTATVATFDVNASGLISMDSTGAGISLDAAAASNFTTSAGALTLNGATGVVIDGSAGSITNGTDNSAVAATGSFTVQTGDVTATANAAGDFAVNLGNSFTGSAGGYSFLAGQATSAGGNGGGFAVVLGATTTGNAGSYTLATGPASAAGGNAGDYSVALGSATTGAAGSYSLVAGGATTGTAGTVELTAGVGGSVSGAGGAMTLKAGAATLNDSGGSLTVGAGDAHGSTGVGGNAIFSSGDGGTDGGGGDWTGQAGNGGSVTGPAGRVFINGGDSVNTSAGNVTIAGGTSTSSTGGNVSIGAGSSTSGNGAPVRIVSGHGVAGNGVVSLRSALHADVAAVDPVVEVSNQGQGTGGGAQVKLFTEDGLVAAAAPTVSSDAGSLYFQQRATTTPRLFMNTSVGATGTAWTEIETGISTLESAYVAGSTATVTDADLSFTLSNTSTTNTSTDIFTVNFSPSVASSGNAVNILTGANVTGDAFLLNNLGSGSAFTVQDGGADVVDVSAAGLVKFTPTSGQDFLVDTLGTGSVSLDAASSSNFTVDGSTAGTLTNSFLATNSDGTAASAAVVDVIANQNSAAATAVVSTVNLQATNNGTAAAASSIVNIKADATGAGANATTATVNVRSTGDSSGVVNTVNVQDTATGSVNVATGAFANDVTVGNSNSSTTFDVIAGGTTAVADSTGWVVTFPTKNVVETANLDADGATNAGVIVNEATYTSFENGSLNGSLVIGRNTGYTAAVGVDTYEVTVVLCNATTDTITAFTNNGAAADPTATLTTGGTQAVGNFVLVTGSINRENDGIYQVVTDAANVLTLEATPTADAGFVKQQVSTTVGDSATVCNVTLSVMRVSAAGEWQIFENANTVASIVYQDFGSTATTLAGSVANVGASPATMSATFDWRISDNQSLSFSTAAASNETLLSLAPAIGADAVQIGNAVAGTVVNIDSAAASSWTVDSANLTLETTTSGVLSLNAAGTFNVTGNGTSSEVTNTGGRLFLRTVTSGDITLDSAAALDIDAAGQITMNSGASAVASGSDLFVTAGLSTFVGGDGGGMTLRTGAASAATGGGGGGEVIIVVGEGAQGTAQAGPIVAGAGGGVTGTLGAGGAATADGTVAQGSAAGDGGGWGVTGGVGGQGESGLGFGAAGNGGEVAFTGGIGGLGSGESVAGDAANGGIGAKVSFVGGKGGNGAVGTVVAADAGKGGNAIIQAGASGDGFGTGNNASGSSIVLIPTIAGTGGSGIAATTDGFVHINSASDSDRTILRLDSGGADASIADMFVGSAVPTTGDDAKAGSVFLYNDNTTEFTGGGAFIQLDANGASGTGDNWERVVTSPVTDVRQFVQGVINRTITGDAIEVNSVAGTDIRQADFTPPITLPVRDASLSFDTQAEIYFNGVLMFNGTGNDVVAAALGDTTKDIWLLAGAALTTGDIVTIKYFNL